MTGVYPCALPPHALLQRYARPSNHVDCDTTVLRSPATQAEFVEAFYTTALFKVERTLLGWLVQRPAADHDAQQLSLGSVSSFSAWRVEAQEPGQLMLCDFTGRTRSWLMAAADAGAAADGGTRLYFGSAVVPPQRRGVAAAGLGWPFHALLEFHRLYSRLLLGAARSRLQRRA